MSSRNRVSLFSELPLAKRNELFKSCEMDDEAFGKRLNEANEWLGKRLEEIARAEAESEDQE